MARTLEQAADELLATALEAFSVLGGRYVMANRDGIVIMSTDDWDEAVQSCRDWHQSAVLLDTEDDDLPEVYANDCTTDFHRKN